MLTKYISTRKWFLKEEPFIYLGFASKNGAGTRNRTADLLITNQSLYQLSYPGAGQRYGNSG